MQVGSCKCWALFDHLMWIPPSFVAREMLKRSPRGHLPEALMPGGESRTDQPGRKETGWLSKLPPWDPEPPALGRKVGLFSPFYRRWQNGSRAQNWFSFVVGAPIQGSLQDRALPSLACCQVGRDVSATQPFPTLQVVCSGSWWEYKSTPNWELVVNIY